MGAHCMYMPLAVWISLLWTVIVVQESSGGLVSALKGVQNYRTKWIGWPGVFVDKGPSRDRLSNKLAKLNFVPVWLDQEIVSHHIPLCTF